MTRDPKLWAALAYVFGLMSGIGVLLVEKQDRYVRFHAMQSVLTFGAVAVVWVLLPTVPIVGDLRLFLGMFWAGVLALWGLLMWKALQGEAYRLPYIGDIAHSMTH
ncbi:MAG: DUF4870 domain-containing protein [Vicinamibacterales bacterium]